MKTTDRIRGVFYEFLVEIDAFPDFIRELKKQKGSTYKGYMNKYDKSAENLIMDAFDWFGNKDNTDMANYWLLIDNKWREKLKSLKV